MEITETREENTIILSVEGRVDTVGAPQLQKAILLAFQKCGTVALDLEKTQYVSSAGLRAFLLGQKTAASKGGFMKLLHVNQVVQDILDVTGFSDILTIDSADVPERGRT